MRISCCRRSRRPGGSPRRIVPGGRRAAPAEVPGPSAASFVSWSSPSRLAQHPARGPMSAAGRSCIDTMIPAGASARLSFAYQMVPTPAAPAPAAPAECCGGCRRLVSGARKRLYHVDASGFDVGSIVHGLFNSTRPFLFRLHPFAIPVALFAWLSISCRLARRKRTTSAKT